MSEQVLIATLGSEPQVVTLALDLLRAQSYPIAAVKVVHTMGESVQVGLKVLAEEFRKSTACSYAAVPIEDGGWPVSDVASDRETAALMRTLYRVVLSEKRAGRSVHLSIAGGRKTVAAYGMVVASFFSMTRTMCGTFIPKKWRPGNERVMYARPRDPVSLLPVPGVALEFGIPGDDRTGGSGRSVGGDSSTAISAARRGPATQTEFVEHTVIRAEREMVPRLPTDQS
jgi:CRISPR-associated protein Csx14